MTPLSGVRSSWDMLARNSVWSLAASRAFLFAKSSCAFLFSRSVSVSLRSLVAWSMLFCISSW